MFYKRDGTELTKRNQDKCPACIQSAFSSVLWPRNDLNEFFIETLHFMITSEVMGFYMEQGTQGECHTVTSNSPKVQSGIDGRV